MTAICYEDIKIICTEWVNDSSTTAAMENQWLDWLVEEKLNEHTAEQLMLALNVNTRDDIIEMPVRHDTYGDMEVYIVILENGGILFSTKEWMLYEENYQKYYVNA